jgi:hypothetical protein
VGDYLGVIASMHHPEYFRRVEKLEYVDADLGRRHLKDDVFYLEAAQMGPVIAWCHGIAGPLILPAGDVHIWRDVPEDRRTSDQRDVYWGVLSGEGEPAVQLLPASPMGPIPGSSIGSRKGRSSGNATSRSRLPLRRHRGLGLWAAVVWWRR